MTALATDRANVVVAGAYRERVGKVAASVVIFKGALLARNLAGYIVPAANTTGFRVVGIAQEPVNTTGILDGVYEVKYLTGLTVKLKNEATALVAQVNIGSPVWVMDDQTVRGTPGNGCVAGIAEYIEADGGIMVYVDPIVGAFEAEAVGIETVSAAGALSVYNQTSLLSIDGTKAYTLASGRYPGQRKTIRCVVATNTPLGTVTSTYVTDGTATTAALFNAIADQLSLEWNGTAWQVIANTSVTLS